MVMMKHKQKNSQKRPLIMAGYWMQAKWRLLSCHLAQVRNTKNIVLRWSPFYAGIRKLILRRLSGQAGQVDEGDRRCLRFEDDSHIIRARHRLTHCHFPSITVNVCVGPHCHPL